MKTNPPYASTDTVAELANQLRTAIPTQNVTVETDTSIVDDPLIEVTYPQDVMDSAVNVHTSVARQVEGTTYGVRFRGEDPNPDGTVTITYEVEAF